MSRADHLMSQYAQIDQLLERMRQADPTTAPTTTQTHDVADVVERDPGKGAFNPALPHVDVARQYRDNLALVNTADPRSLGRRPDGQKVTVRVFEERGADMHPGHKAPQSVGLQRQRRSTAKETTKQTPQEAWVQYGVPGSLMNDASRAIESLRQQSLNQPTHVGSDPSQTGGSSQVDAAPETEFFDASVENAPAATVASNGGPELTNPDFDYTEGESAYDQWLEHNAPRSQIESGRGKEISDDAYGVTVTYHAEIPKKNS